MNKNIIFRVHFDVEIFNFLCFEFLLNEYNFLISQYPGRSKCDRTLKVQIWPKISNVLGCLLIVLWDSQIFLGCLLIFLWDSGPPKVPFLDRFRALPPWKLPKRSKIFAARFARQFSKMFGNFHGFWASKYLFWTLFRAFPPWKLPKRSKFFAARANLQNF